MLDRIKGKIVFECDGCGEALEPDLADFNEALADMKSQGWRAQKVGTDWCHYCESCRYEQRQE